MQKRRLAGALVALLLVAGMGPRIFSATQAQEPKPAKLYFLTLVHPTWKNAEEQARFAPMLKEHGEYVKKQFEAGKLVVAGPRLDGVYGIDVLEVDSAQEARQIMENDPAVKAGAFQLEMHAIRGAFVRPLR